MYWIFSFYFVAIEHNYILEKPSPLLLARRFVIQIVTFMPVSIMFVHLSGAPAPLGRAFLSAGAVIGTCLPAFSLSLATPTPLNIGGSMANGGGGDMGPTGGGEMAVMRDGGEIGCDRTGSTCC